jgi:hypothetical protein
MLKHHQNMPLPSMYQDTITKDVSQTCTKPSTCTIPNINHVPQPVPHQVHQPYTITCTICLNHQSCTSTIYISTCTIPCTNNVSQPYTMSLNHAIHHIPRDIPFKYYQWCTSTKYQHHQEMYLIHVLSYTKCIAQQCININDNHTSCSNAARVYQE